MERLLRYFTEGVENQEIGASIGTEVETSFVDRMDRPISVERSQKLFKLLIARHRWQIRQRKGELITELHRDGNKILYELGRQNIELATIPLSAKDGMGIITHAKSMLEGIYDVGEEVGAYPYFQPILPTDEKLLIVPDERDAIWVELDGRPALELLARISAVQFTVAVPPQEAIRCLNRLGKYIGFFLKDYPQELQWRRYVKESRADYHPLRYGGPLFFSDLTDYCRKLLEHDVVTGSRLVPHEEAGDFYIPLFLRSIWWYFRLKRYGNTLCIEIRPLARRNDRYFQAQLDMVRDILL